MCTDILKILAEIPDKERTPEEEKEFQNGIDQMTRDASLSTRKTIEAAIKMVNG